MINKAISLQSVRNNMSYYNVVTLGGDRLFNLICNILKKKIREEEATWQTKWRWDKASCSANVNIHQQ